MTIGHIVDQERFLRFQVMDTPGLLDRPEEERNEMEKLTFASLLVANFFPFVFIILFLSHLYRIFIYYM